MPQHDVSSSHRKARLPGLDPEAVPVIGIGLGVAGLLLGLRPRLAAWPLALTALAALMYRDPERDTPTDSPLVFAPADGVLIGVDEQYEHRFLHTDALRLSITVSPLDVPVQRSPVAGMVAYLERVAGAERPLWELRAAEHSEQQYIGLATGWGPALVVITAGPLARRVACPLALGEHVEAGGRIASVRLGAQVDLLLPRDVVIGIPAANTRLKAGVSPLGRVATP
jgi:phosphatidylserine decarboxylase